MRSGGDDMSIDVDALKGATDLVSVVGNVVPLVKRGSEWVGKCVAHSPGQQPVYVREPEERASALLFAAASAPT